jgi:hypothetical protein
MKIPCRRRVLAVLLPLIGIATLGCGKGYPTGDLPPRSASERVEQIDELLSTHKTDARRISLTDACHLSVQWKGQSGTEIYSLRDLRVSVDTDDSTGHFLVRIRRSESEENPPLLLAASTWVQMTFVRSDLDQLRADCVNSQRNEQ